MPEHSRGGSRLLRGIRRLNMCRHSGLRKPSKFLKPTRNRLKKSVRWLGMRIPHHFGGYLGGVQGCRRQPIERSSRAFHKSQSRWAPVEVELSQNCVSEIPVNNRLLRPLRPKPNFLPGQLTPFVAKCRATLEMQQCERFKVASIDVGNGGIGPLEIAGMLRPGKDRN